MPVIKIIFYVVILGLALTIVAITLSLNVKSEGLGAAITGASDTYRGAVGVEEQKRRLLSRICYGFVIVTFIFALLNSRFF
jgi:preprotein translocase subunit SecG